MTFPAPPLPPGRIATTFRQRCFYLLAALVLLAVALPFVHTQVGSALTNVLSGTLVVAAVAAAGRSRAALVIAGILAVPTLLLHSAGVATQAAHLIALSLASGAALYLVALVYLLRYVMHRDVLTLDKLYGAAATYLLLGVLWAYLYALLEYLSPGSFALEGATTAFNLRELAYFSFTTLTTTGFGDITPVHPVARTLVNFEQVTGVLYVAILIARLAGSYGPSEPRA